jgi:hypothetical protein
MTHSPTVASAVIAHVGRVLLVRRSSPASAPVSRPVDAGAFCVCAHFAPLWLCRTPLTVVCQRGVGSTTGGPRGSQVG